MARAGRVVCAGELLVEFVASSKNGRHRRADAYRGPFDVVRELTAIASIFLPSDDDAEALCPGLTLSDYGAKLCARGAEYVVLKRGDRGAKGYRERARRSNCPRTKWKCAIRPERVTVSAAPSSA